MDDAGNSIHDALRTTIFRTTRSYSTELARIRREFPDTAGTVDIELARIRRESPGPAGTVDMATSTNHDVSRTNAIAPMDSPTRRNNTHLARISREADRLDNPGIVSQNQDFHRQVQRFGDSQVLVSRIESYRHSDHHTHPANTGTSEASPTRVETFLQSLPLLSLTNLPYDSQDCPICMEHYLSPQHNEVPVRLPCTHVIGKDCLRSWLNSSVLNRNNDACPMCRAVLFKPDMATVASQLRDINTMLDRGWDADTQRIRTDLAHLNEIVNRHRGNSQEGAVAARSRDTRAATLEHLNGENAALREDLARLQTTTGARRESLNHASAALRERLARVRETLGHFNGSDPALSELPGSQHAGTVQRERHNPTSPAAREAFLRGADRGRAPDNWMTGDAENMRREYPGGLRERRGAIREVDRWRTRHNLLTGDAEIDIRREYPGGLRERRGAM